jgi:signal transduction histidine kinase
METVPLPPSERASAADLEAQARVLEAIPVLGRILNALPALAMVLNRQRQVVLANQKLAEFAGATGLDELCGFRPGEILQCVRALETESGCGATKHCIVCGALRAILTAQLGRAQTQICRVLRQTPSGEEALELEISAAPIQVGDELFTIVCASDISGRLRREWVERRAVPQALELALEMEVLSSSLASAETRPEVREKVIVRMAAASRRVASLMREHAELVSAEAGDLEVHRLSASALEIQRGAARDFEYHEAADGLQIQIDAGSQDATVDTDLALARHAFARFVLNALEASPRGGVVSVGCRAADGQAELWVRNAGEMPRAVQLQVFQRSFSTKGEGRGYGAYFTKLIAERYLGGTVSFRSTAEEGTTFSMFLPVLTSQGS